MTNYDKKRITTKAQAEARINELHSTVIVPIDLIGLVPRGRVRTIGDTDQQDQALAEIRELQRVFGITYQRPKK